MAVREPSFLILAALASERAHGYRVIQEVERLSEGRVKLRAGTLYAALDRLESDGLIELDGQEVVDGRNRRYYVITSQGREALEGEIVRIESNAAAARMQLGLS